MSTIDHDAPASPKARPVGGAMLARRLRRAAWVIAVALPLVSSLVVAIVASGAGLPGRVATTTPAAPLGADPAEVLPVRRGKLVRVVITAQDRTIEIAPGVRYRAWTFNGRVPGPLIHVRQGQQVEITFRNHASVPHSFDIHAARIPANVAFKDVYPGRSIRFRFVARDPGVFVYHCVTRSALMHIANGMYGAMIVDPRKPLPRAHKEFVLVAGEWYLDRGNPAQIDMAKALATRADWVTFNGYADRYADRPLHADPGRLVRFYVVNAGPNLVTPFHAVGGIFDRVYENGDVTHWLTGVQTADVPAGGGAIFDLRFDRPGVYGFVSHSFANVDKGERGTLIVGKARGRVRH